MRKRSLLRSFQPSWRRAPFDREARRVHIPVVVSADVCWVRAKPRGEALVRRHSVTHMAFRAHSGGFEGRCGPEQRDPRVRGWQPKMASARYEEVFGNVDLVSIMLSGTVGAVELANVSRVSRAFREAAVRDVELVRTAAVKTGGLTATVFGHFFAVGVDVRRSLPYAERVTKSGVRWHMYGPEAVDEVLGGKFGGLEGLVERRRQHGKPRSAGVCDYRSWQDTLLDRERRIVRAADEKEAKRLESASMRRFYLTSMKSVGHDSIKKRIRENSVVAITGPGLVRRPVCVV
jgi:hypothetical protein